MAEMTDRTDTMTEDERERNAAKQELRREMLARRRQVTAAEQQAASTVICAKLTRLLESCPAGVVFSYLAYGREVDLAALHEYLWQSGRRLAVPQTAGLPSGEMRAVLLGPATELGRAGLGVYEPLGAPEIDPAEIGVVLTPGVAFDAALNRLGHGKGYYDRFLPRLSAAARVIGVAYKWQVLPAVPAGRYDRPMDELVTD